MDRPAKRRGVVTVVLDDHGKDTKRDTRESPAKEDQLDLVCTHSVSVSVAPSETLQPPVLKGGHGRGLPRFRRGLRSCLREQLPQGE